MHTFTLHDWPDDSGKPVGYTFEFAGSWEECPVDHFPQAALARAAPEAHGGVRLQLLRLLGGVPAALVARFPPAENFTRLVDVPAEFGEFGQPLRPARLEMRLLPELDWVFGPATLITSKMPSLKHGGHTWMGPDNNLTHMTLDQWRWCVKLLKHYREDKHDARRETHLNNLLGALYTPHTPAGAPTGSAWSSLPIEDHASRLSDLPLETKLAAAFNFEALNAVLPRQYKRTFGGESDGPTSPQGILDISYDVAESGALGDFDAVNARLLHTVLGYMENNLYKDERQAERMEAAARE